MLDEKTAPKISKDRKGICGTPLCMFPEHFFTPEKVDNRSDIYSFGCVLHEMVTGKPPFQTFNILQIEKAHLEKIPLPPHKVNPEVPKPLGEIILKCLSKSPEDRYQSFAKLKEVLHSISESLK